MNYTGAINHIGLSCSDLAKSRKFYDLLLIDLLGYNVVMDQPYCVIYSKKTGESTFFFFFFFIFVFLFPVRQPGKAIHEY